MFEDANIIFFFIQKTRFKNSSAKIGVICGKGNPPLITLMYAE